jgi:hypothetical protein
MQLGNQSRPESVPKLHGCNLGAFCKVSQVAWMQLGTKPNMASFLFRAWQISILFFSQT